MDLTPAAHRKLRRIEHRVMELLHASGAIHSNGHYRLSAGEHSEYYVNMREGYTDPQILRKLCCLLVERFLMEETPVDAFIGPANTGIAVAQWITFHYNQLRPSTWPTARATYAAKKTTDTLGYTLPDTFKQYIDGKRVAFVDDVGTSGLAGKNVAKLVAENGGIPVAVCYILNRDNVTAEKVGGYPVIAAATKTFPRFTEDHCKAHGPCAHGVPLDRSLGHGGAHV